jgi:hypothetical protein
MSGGTGMPESQLFLVSANKSQPSGQWSRDDYDAWRKTNFPVSTVGNKSAVPKPRDLGPVLRVIVRL